MRLVFQLIILIGLCAGCSHLKPKHPHEAAGKTKSTQPAPIAVVPVEFPSGKIVSVNAELRYVVVDFGVGRAPTANEHLDIYRQSQKVGELKISQQSRSNLFAADIVAGDARVGDEVKVRH